MNKEKLIDLGSRALKTYLQTSIGLILASGIGIDNGGLSVWRAALLGGIPAALSIIQNGLRNWKV